MARSRRVATPAVVVLFVPAVVLARTGFPATGYGAVYFGYDDLSPQAGMNEAGVF